MDYRHWPPESSEPPREDPQAAGWTPGGNEHDAWSAWHHGTDEGHHHPNPPARQPYGYTDDPHATQIYPAVPPGPRHARSPAQPPPAPRPESEPVEDPAFTPAVVWTVGFFVVPVLLYLVWIATRSGVAPAGCFDASGAPCPSPRAGALASLVGNLPGLVGALALALLAAVGLRRVAANWRPGTVALAAAVIGSGSATLIASMLS